MNHIKILGSKVQRLILIVCLVVLLSIVSCGRKEISNPQEFLKWMNDPQNGLVQTKKINNIKITVKYLPPSFMTYQEVKLLSPKSNEMKDSLMDSYSKNKSFLLTIGPDQSVEGNTGDIMFRDITKMEDYKERSQIMNFEMAEFIDLKTEKGKYKPVIASLENVYGLSSDRSILLVFTGNEDINSSNELDLVYNDELFNTGINHFVFNSKDFNKVPNFIF